MLQNQERTLGDLFDNPVKGEKDSYLRIPRFQRKYEWDKEKEVLRLLDDLYENLNRNYFMGPLIFCAKDGQEYIEIVDGQQRLITFALFYRAMVDYIQTRRESGAFTPEIQTLIEQIQNSMRSKIVKGWIKKRHAVLHISKRMDKFFRDNIILNDTSDKFDNVIIPLTQVSFCAIL